MESRGQLNPLTNYPVNSVRLEYPHQLNPTYSELAKGFSTGKRKGHLVKGILRNRGKLENIRILVIQILIGVCLYKSRIIRDTENLVHFEILRVSNLL